MDLYAEDHSHSNETIEAFYAHVKLHNPNAHTVDGYWWTNIGVPVTNTSRVLYDPSQVSFKVFVI